MVVNASTLDLGHLAFFLGLRVNALVVEQMEAAGFRDVRESHGFVIQHLIDTHRSVTELATRMGVTQQAASKVVAELATLGVVKVAPADDRRAKRVELSDRGRNIVGTARRLRRRIDQRLRGRLGPQAYAVAHQTLVEALTTLGGLDAVATRSVKSPK